MASQVPSVVDPTQHFEHHEPVVVPLPFQNLQPEKTERLSIEPTGRILVGGFSGGVVGFFLGVSEGSQREGFRFRAENAHRLPTSQKGWYFYHKSKNYQSMFGGVKEGFRMGTRTGFWVGSFLSVEAALDNWRGGGEHMDFMSTTIAGLTTAGAFSLWNRLPAPTTVRTAHLGFKIGLGLGVLQDLLALARGRKLAYVELIKRVATGQRADEVDNGTSTEKV